MKIQHTEATQLAQNLQNISTQATFATSNSIQGIDLLFKKENTCSMCKILLKERSSQARREGSARKWLTVFWSSYRSVMSLLFRRRELLRYFLSEFLFKGRRPFLGSMVNASKTVSQENLTVSVLFYEGKMLINNAQNKA